MALLGASLGVSTLSGLLLVALSAPAAGNAARSLDPAAAAAGEPATAEPGPAASQQGNRAGARQPRSAGRGAQRRPSVRDGASPAAPRSDGRGTATPAARPGTATDGGVDNPFGYPPEQQQQIWFNIADSDGTNWISFREARASMRFDAPRFRVFDIDNDGRMTFEEYRSFVISESAGGHNVRPPKAVRADGKTPRRDADQLRAAYDADLDGAISRLEFERMLTDYDKRRAEFDIAVVYGGFDDDGSGVLEGAELGRVSSFLSPLGIGPGGGSTIRPGARTVDDLFGKRVDRGEANPPQIPGPMSPFRRLDLDGDGFVSLEDLERLEGRSGTTVRLGSVLNTLDIDFDGRLSEGEFMSCMTSPVRSPDR